MASEESGQKSSTIDEVSHLQKEKRDTQEESPKIDTARSLRKTIQSLIDEGVEVEQLKESEKRRRSRFQEKGNDEKTAEETTEELVETIVARFLEEQRNAQAENTLKIEIVENS